MIAQIGQRLVGFAFNLLYVAGRRYAVYDQSSYVEQHRTPDERATGFDWTLYQVMVNDRARVGAYRKDIEALVPGKTVLEVGPGPHAALTVIAAEAGAASILSIEANDWAAAEARRRVRRYGDRVRVVAGHTDQLSAEAVGEPRPFDVLLIECYHAIASQERVVETISSLRRSGWSFDAVISKGFTTFVAPAAGPSSARMTRLERVVAGWPADRRAADAAMAERWSSMHGDMPEVASRRLAPAEAWQWCDFEGDGRLNTEATLRFPVSHVEDFAGLQFFNHFHFHHGHLDTGETPTDWGVYFVPVTGGAAIGRRTGPGELVLRTTQLDPERPSLVELAVELDGVSTEALRL
jgi:hypothetical protein